MVQRHGIDSTRNIFRNTDIIELCKCPPVCRRKYILMFSYNWLHLSYWLLAIKEMEHCLYCKFCFNYNLNKFK